MTKEWADQRLADDIREAHDRHARRLAAIEERKAKILASGLDPATPPKERKVVLDARRHEAALMRLREIVVLREVEGLTFKEIGAKYGHGVSNASMLYRRAVRLRERGEL